MSAVTMWDGLEERLATVSGLKARIFGEPTAIQTTPMLYSVFDRTERKAEGRAPSNSTVTIIKYFFAHRIVVQWLSNAEAEAQLISFVNPIPVAINSDPTLGGRVDNAQMSEGVTGFATIAGTKYRVLDFTSEILEKIPRSAGI